MVKVSAGLVSPEVSLLGLQMASFSLCPRMNFPLCTGLPGVTSSPYKSTSHSELGSHTYDFI